MSPKSCTIRLTGLRKSYRVGETRVEALKGVSLDVLGGEMVALSGPSGSGKSTLLNLCGLIDTPDAGSRELGSATIDDLDEIALTRLRREKVGFIFQGFNLVPVMTVYDNVEYPLLLLGVAAAERRQRTLTALQQVGLEGLARRLPDALSGGQRQRVAIARALVKSPALVIADEPTANLDSITARQIVGLLHDLAVKTWRDLAVFYQAVRALYNRIFGILGLIMICIVLFAMSNTLGMAVVERTREIGTLRAIGTLPAEIVRNFVLEGMLIGGAGTVAGMLLAGIATVFLLFAGIEMPPPPGRSAGYPLLLGFSPLLYGAVALVVVVLAAGAAWLVSRRAANKPVTEALAHV